MTHNAAATSASSAKEEIRKTMLAGRAALTDTEREERSLRICSGIRRIPAWRRARSVLLYMPARNEVDVTTLLRELWSSGVATYLPRCRPKEEGAMDIACVDCFEQLKPGSYGIMEPDPVACLNIEDCRPDVALVPAVAFDRAGNRLGFGAGYYDRRLAMASMQDTVLIGPAYDFQIVDALPVDEWDRPVHVVAAEEEIIWT